MELIESGWRQLSIIAWAPPGVGQNSFGVTTTGEVRWLTSGAGWMLFSPSTPASLPSPAGPAGTTLFTAPDGQAVVRDGYVLLGPAQQMYYVTFVVNRVADPGQYHITLQPVT